MTKVSKKSQTKQSCKTDVSGSVNGTNMKETFRERIERELKAMIDRQKQLDRYVKEYVDAGNLGDAAINQIKCDTLTMVISRLEEALSQH